jgi:glycyl-tRNA synthetase
LTQHTNATGVRLCAEKPLPAPKTIEITEAVPNKQVLGKSFKKDAKAITELLAKLSLDDVKGLESTLNEKG